MSASADLVESIRSVKAPTELFSLAVTALAMMATADRLGPLFVVHVALLAIARNVDGEGLTDAEWVEVTALLAALAVYLQAPDSPKLDAIGVAWRRWRNPASLH